MMEAISPELRKSFSSAGHIAVGMLERGKECACQLKLANDDRSTMRSTSSS